MKVITKNKDNTVGIVTGVENLKDLGEFRINDIREWLSKVETMFGDTGNLHIRFKLSDDPKRLAYLIAASSTEQADPMVVVTGQHRLDGKEWGA